MQRYIDALRTPGPARMSAIAAIFDAAQSQMKVDDLESAIQKCITICNDPQAVSLAIERLLLLGRSLGNHRDTMNTLLTAFSLLPATATARALAEAYVAMYFESCEISNGEVTEEFAGFSDISKWKSHPLNRLLLASPSQGTLVSMAVCWGMVRFGLKAKVSFASWFRRFVWPFTTFVFLYDCDSTTSLILLDGLVRAGSVGGAAVSRPLLLHLCMTILPSLPLSTSVPQSTAASVAEAVVDMHHELGDEGTVETVVDRLVVTAEHIVECQGSPRPFLNAAHAVLQFTLEKKETTCLSPRTLVILASLAAKCASEDAVAALTLYKIILASGYLSTSMHPGVIMASLHALTAVWLLPIISFGHNATVNSLAMSILHDAVAALRRVEPGRNVDAETKLPKVDQEPPLQTVAVSPAQLAFVQVVKLASTRSHAFFPSNATTDVVVAVDVMLAGLLLEATRTKTLGEPAINRNCGTASMLPQLHLALISNLATLLAANRKSSKLSAHVISMIPVVLQIVASSVACGNTHLAIEMLYNLLPKLAGTAQHAVPYVIHALKQTFFASPSVQKTEALEALGLRLLCCTWIESRSSKAYAALVDAMANHHVHDNKTDSEIASAQAACLVDIAVHGGVKAADHATAIVDCLPVAPGQHDSANPPPPPFIMAAGLGAIASLCESDILDYVKAWRVVHARVPILPAHPAPAVQWLRLLSHGITSRDGLDDETVHGITEALWSRCDSEKTPVVDVRTQARRLLTNVLLKNSDLCSTFFVAHDPKEVAGLLLSEPDQECLPECEALAVLACTYEQRHTTRKGREYSTDQTRPRAQGLGRLAATVPATLLRPYVTSSPDRDEVSMAAILSLWSSRTSEGFESTYVAADSLPSTRLLPAFATPEGSPPSMLLASWTRFIRRWLSTDYASPHHHRHVYDCILQHGDSSSTPWAVAALVRCSHITSSLIREVVTGALNLLFSRAASSEGSSGRLPWLAAIGATLANVAEVLGKDAATQRLNFLVEAYKEKKDVDAVVGLGLAAKDPTLSWSSAPMDAVLQGLKSALDSSFDSHQDVSASWINTVAYAAADALRGVTRAQLQGQDRFRAEIRMLYQRVEAVLRIACHGSPFWRGAAGGLFDFYQASATLVCSHTEIITVIEELFLPVLQQSEEGAMIGAVAAALGCLFPPLVEGLSASTFSDVGKVVQLTTQCIEGVKFLLEHRAARSRSRATAKIGAVSGLSSLLLVLPKIETYIKSNEEDLNEYELMNEHGLESFVQVQTQKEKLRLIALLTDTATSDPDPHVKWGAAWPVSWLCWVVRETNTKSEDPQHGAYLSLVEALGKTSVDKFCSVRDSLRAAALLRTLAALPRIFNLSDEQGWLGVCRRLCEERNGENLAGSVHKVLLQRACVMLAAAHVAHSAPDLREFLLCDVFVRHSNILSAILMAPPPEVEGILPRALTALPEGETVSALMLLVSAAPLWSTEVKTSVVRALRALILQDGRSSVVEGAVGGVLMELLNSVEPSCLGMVVGLKAFALENGRLSSNVETESSARFWESVAEFVGAVVESRGWVCIETKEKTALKGNSRVLWTFIRTAASFRAPESIELLQVPRSWLFQIGKSDDDEIDDVYAEEEGSVIPVLMGKTVGRRLPWLVDLLTAAILHAERDGGGTGKILNTLWMVIRLVAAALTEGELAVECGSLSALPMALTTLVPSTTYPPPRELSPDAVVLIQKLMEALVMVGGEGNELVVACWSALGPRMSSDSPHLRLQRAQLWARTARPRQV